MTVSQVNFLKIRTWWVNSILWRTKRKYGILTPSVIWQEGHLMHMASCNKNLYIPRARDTRQCSPSSFMLKYMWPKCLRLAYEQRWLEGNSIYGMYKSKTKKIWNYGAKSMTILSSKKISSQKIKVFKNVFYGCKYKNKDCWCRGTDWRCVGIWSNTDKIGVFQVHNELVSFKHIVYKTSSFMNMNFKY